MNTDKKVEALRKFLGVEGEGQIIEVQRDGLFTCDSGEFQVLTDTEADIAAYGTLTTLWKMQSSQMDAASFLHRMIAKKVKRTLMANGSLSTG